MKWKFIDLTHKQPLTATILRQLPNNAEGKLFQVQLFNGSNLDIGANILALAEAQSEVS